MFPGPATLWGPLVSDCEKEPVHSERDEAEYDSSDAAATDIASLDGWENAKSSEIVGTLPAGPAILWGILRSEAESARWEEVDDDAMVDLWLAAGYDCPLPMDEETPSTAAIDPMSVNDEIPTQSCPPPNLNSPYTVKVSPGKGQGIFAARPISKGELILLDTPFFLIRKPYNAQKVLSVFERMPLPKRLQYMQLSCPDRPDSISLIDVMRIFEANCFNIGDRAAIFHTATRFNHSCLPNTYYAWSAPRNEISFHAMLPIAQGVEMTICYGRPFRTCQERRSELHIYNFRCGCAACDVSTAFGHASESRRLEMRELEERIFTFQSMPDEAALSNGSQDPLKVILRLIELIKEEGLHGESMTSYRNAADCLKARGDIQEAMKYARLELEEEVVCFGTDSDVVASTKMYIADLEMALDKEVEEEAGGQTASYWEQMEINE